MAAAALPAIKKQIQREREAELIFRGLQYAEAIRVFQQRFGRYPNSLNELIELEPRSIRQLWTDPMTGERDWALVLASGGQPQPGGEGGGDAGDAAGDSQGRELVRSSAPTDSFGGAGVGQPQTTGPILGVVSRKKGVAARYFLGKELYQEWRFTANILPKPQVLPDSNVVKRGTVTDLGKAFPRGLTPPAVTPQGSDLAGGLAPSDSFEDEDDG